MGVPQWLSLVACCLSGLSAAAPLGKGVLPGPLVRVVLVTRLADDADAERIVLPAQELTAGKPMVVQGRLARLTLVARPWEGDLWQVRYELKPSASGRQTVPPGVFSLRENENKEVWLGPSAPSRSARNGVFHGVRLEFESASQQGTLKTL
ncbi:MAG: hypothetical protein IOD12_13785 [Silvanigrellales bacterium]|jgi:hypothetical protein|nr:hypothetical protein [Silvanigrellales bacterium]